MSNSKKSVYCQYLIEKDFQYFLYTLGTYLSNNNGYNLNIVNDKDIIKIGKYEINVLSCQLLIYDEELDRIKAICYCDCETHLSNLIEKRNNSKDIFVHAQNGNTKIRYYNEMGFKFKFIPANYLPEKTNFSSLDNFYLKRKTNTILKDKLIFRGNANKTLRTSLVFLKNSKFFEGYGSIPALEYFNSITEYKVGLSIPGGGELCHRDVEYMAIGIPFIKFKYITKWEPELIPNYHYIAIDRIDNSISKEKYGGEEYAKLYLDKFLEIKDNIEFLNFISKNAKKYYEENLHPIKRFYKILEYIEE